MQENGGRWEVERNEMGRLGGVIRVETGRGGGRTGTEAKGKGGMVRKYRQGSEGTGSGGERKGGMQYLGC